MDQDYDYVIVGGGSGLVVGGLVLRKFWPYRD